MPDRAFTAFHAFCELNVHLLICVKAGNLFPDYTLDMENEALLEAYGLFRAKVPRFTSYPPANRFQLDGGRRHQANWLRNVPDGASISVYAHIPFCRRLCYFCACRTQGTKTLKPVRSYLDTLIAEIIAVRHLLPRDLKMARLHFGGGTPTLLDTELMNQLCETLFSHFATTPDFEFSVEIDPTEAPAATLETLADWRMGRASIGIQDFAPKVQETIGREQSFDQTKSVVDALRALGVQSVNFDLVYGLPHQTEASLQATLEQVLSLHPDRLALYGYAHVPQMSKRQVLISADDLPGARARFRLAQAARAQFEAAGYRAIGIDHFGLASDSLTQAAASGALRRNFQGYTDDPCETLVGFGASAISEFREGYVQNAVATAGYTDRVRIDGLAGHRGYRMSAADRMMSDLVQGVMCRGEIDQVALRAAHPAFGREIDDTVTRLYLTYPDALVLSETGLTIRPEAASLARVIAAAAASERTTQGSMAI